MFPQEAQNQALLGHFVLSEDADAFRLSGTLGASWEEITVGALRRLDFVVRGPGELMSPAVKFTSDACISIALELSPDSAGAALGVVFVDAATHQARTIVEITLDPNVSPAFSSLFYLSSLQGTVGSVRLSIVPSAPVDGVTLRVKEFVLASEEQLTLLRARRHRARRIAAETAHFANVYSGPMFAKRNLDLEGAASEPEHAVPRLEDVEWSAPHREVISLEAVATLDAAAVRELDEPFHYTHRVLGALIGKSGPNFGDELRARYDGKTPVRVLSLCSGAAGIEKLLIERAGCPVEITLLDINEPLLKDAVTRLSSVARVHAMVGDVNKLSVSHFRDRRFDVVMCVSALHHVVELERVLEAATYLLEPKGQFWVIGEQIGPNGNRLWPDARREANLVFRGLPERLRKNAHTGRVDETLPDEDYSSLTFEGIRSVEIEPLLSQYFEPTNLFRRNCFLWRLVNQTYAANYDLTHEEDRISALRIVTAEYNFWKHGGRPTESHSIYERR